MATNVPVHFHLSIGDEVNTYLVEKDANDSLAAFAEDLDPEDSSTIYADEEETEILVVNYLNVWYYAYVYQCDGGTLAGDRCPLDFVA
jgi:hypothetical protein